MTCRLEKFTPFDGRIIGIVDRIGKIIYNPNREISKIDLFTSNMK
jgi:hypothetical protein